MKFWRQEPPEITQDGVVTKGGMFSHQSDWWEMSNFVKALIAGYGAGKTMIGSKRQIALAIHNAPSPALVISPSYKMAKRTVIPMITALLNGKRTLHRDLWFKYNKTDHEFKIRWRGREGLIWVGSGDEPQSLKGPNVGSGWIDEPFIQDEDVLDETMARIRDPLARVRELAMTGTPEQLNWGYDICEGERKDDYDVGLIYAHTRQNLALGREYADRLERALTVEAAEAYLAGHFVNLSKGRTYYGFDRHRNVKKLPDPGTEFGIGMDFNVNPMAAIAFWVNGPHMHIVKEIELPNADTYMMCKHIQDNVVFPKNHPHAGNCRVLEVFPDATGTARKTSTPYGRSDFTIIQSFGFSINAPPSNPHVRDRENAVNGKFRPSKGEPTLTVDPSCKRLIGYFEKFTNENRNKEEYKRMTHLLDATGYPVHRMFPIHKSSVIARELVGT